MENINEENLYNPVPGKIQHSMDIPINGMVISIGIFLGVLY